MSTLAIYRDPRLLAVLAMGFASGVPFPLTTTTLTYWLARDGLDKTAIGLFALVGLPYSLKFLWAPLIDRAAFPGLATLGRRRSWILVLQAMLVGTFVALGFVDPKSAPWLTAAVVFAIAFFSASQDIAVDAYRIEILADSEQGAGAAATQAGYRAGLLAAGAGAIAAADFVDWPTIYAGLACLLALAMLAVVFASEPAPPTRSGEEARSAHPAQSAALGAASAAAPAPTLARAFVEPLRAIVGWSRWPLVLAFALLYKVGDSVAGAMTSPFFVELGFTGVEIASITKVLGVLASVAGIFVGGLLVARTSIRPALLFGGILQATTNLLYAWLAAKGHDLQALTLSIVADQFTGGLAAAAFVAYFSSLCRGAWSGSQYALLTSLMATGRTLIAGGSGWLASQTGWSAFFSATAAFALPGLLLLAALPDPTAPREDSKSAAPPRGGSAPRTPRPEAAAGAPPR